MRFHCLAVVVVAVIVAVILFFASFGTLEYQEIGLNYSFITETISKDAYTSGRYFLGIGAYFIKFPKSVITLLFSEQSSERKDGPAMLSRTFDGLNVKLEVSFQYRLNPLKLYDLYTTLGPEYEKILIRTAFEHLTTAATKHTAHDFFTNRSFIAFEMQKGLNKNFQDACFAEVPLFQLRTVYLPELFENAIRDTQVKEQEILIARAERDTRRVTFETEVIQAKQQVQIMNNNAEADASAILLSNQAYVDQYKISQELQSSALSRLSTAAAWNPTQLLEYLKIKAVREHPADRTTVRL